MSEPLTIGSLFSGYGGLDMAVERVFDAKTAWLVEFDKHPSMVLERRFPGVPNLGDVTQIDWTEVEPVDIITGGSPCFTAGTLVDTWDGYRPIEEVRIGDKVRTHTGRYMPVTDTGGQVAQETTLLRVMGAPEFTTTPDHPFYVRKRSKVWNKSLGKYERRWSDPEWVPAAELTKDHFVGFQIDQPGEEGIGIDLAYLLGRWLGDGWIRDGKRTSNIPQGQRGSRVNSRWWNVIICAGHHKADHLEEKIAAAGFKATKTVERTTTKFTIYSKELVQKLDGFGRYAHGKKIPGWVFRLPLEEQEAMWNGYFDADGTTNKTGRRKIVTVSEELAHGVSRLARNVFHRATSVHKTVTPDTKVIEGRTVNQRDYYEVNVPTVNRTAFVEEGWAWAPVRESKAGGPAQVFNLSVEEDESYTAWGITVHNCQDLSSAGKRAGMTEGTRSNLWVAMREAIETIQPRYVVWENVRGALSAKAESESDMESEGGLLGKNKRGHLRALGRVAGDLDEIGYDTEWTTLRASDIGAPHHRERVFLLAWRRE